MRRHRNRYADLMKHKKIQKKKYMNHMADLSYGGSLRMMEDDLKTDEPNYYKRLRNHGFEYWQESYLSGCRRFAKNLTNRVIRAKYRDLIRSAEEDVIALNGSEYEKEFDYNWTVW